MLAKMCSLLGMSSLGSATACISGLLQTFMELFNLPSLPPTSRQGVIASYDRIIGKREGVPGGGTELARSLRFY
jgi:hypothetical protein